jgi:cysteine-rich repeat protein
LPLTAPNRNALLAAADERVDDAGTGLALRLATRCNAEQFAAVYGRTPAVFIDGLSTRADCVGARFYIQDAVLCPSPVCGNGIVEEPETCDDGNTNGGDGCPPTCELP